VEDAKEPDGADGRPVGHGPRRERAPLVEDEPDGLLGGEVRVPRPRPEPGHDKAAVQVLLTVRAVGRQLRRLQVRLLRNLVVCARLEMA
jgi:hypothetical protein